MSAPSTAVATNRDLIKKHGSPMVPCIATVHAAAVVAQIIVCVSPEQKQCTKRLLSIIQEMMVNPKHVEVCEWTKRTKRLCDGCISAALAVCAGFRGDSAVHRGVRELMNEITRLVIGVRKFCTTVNFVPGPTVADVFDSEHVTEASITEWMQREDSPSFILSMDINVIKQTVVPIWVNLNQNQHFVTPLRDLIRLMSQQTKHQSKNQS